LLIDETCKEAVVSCFNVLLSRICLEWQENHRNPQSGWFASSSKFKAKIFVLWYTVCISVLRNVTVYIKN